MRRWLLLVDPRGFWAPGPAVGPGCTVGGPRAIRAASFARRFGSLSDPAAHGCHSLASSIPQDSHRAVTSHVPEPTPNFACNSPTTLSNLEIRSLELQRFLTLLKLHLIELHASCLKPVAPLLAQAEPQLKPSSPLRVRNGRFWRVFRAQRCRRFQRLLLRGEQW